MESRSIHNFLVFLIFDVFKRKSNFPRFTKCNQFLIIILQNCNLKNASMQLSSSFSIVIFKTFVDQSRSTIFHRSVIRRLNRRFFKILYKIKRLSLIVIFNPYRKLGLEHALGSLINSRAGCFIDEMKLNGTGLAGNVNRADRWSIYSRGIAMLLADKA